MTMALRLLGANDEAQDAAQEVFLRCFKYLHRLDLQKPVEPWLMRMTINVCRDIGRKRQQRRSIFVEIAAPETIDQSGDPHSGLAGQQECEMLWKALNDLPEKERMAIVLRDVEGFSTSEVAAILKSSESTVRSQVSRGRLRLKEAMDRALAPALNPALVPSVAATTDKTSGGRP
jgi:RNA polymerase sigma-70 factor (ECF subfamily)